MIGQLWYSVWRAERKENAKNKNREPQKLEGNQKKNTRMLTIEVPEMWERKGQKEYLKN